MIWLASGAYGREATEKDWNDGKDFQFVGGPYFSKRDMKDLWIHGVSQIDFFGKDGFVAFSVKVPR